MKRATIKDIALALAINPSTVSRALNNHPDVSNAMKEKVKQVASLLHYTPNLTAINLKTKKTKTIGLILPTISKFFIPSIINGIASVINQHGYRLVILSSDESVEKEKDHIIMCCNTQMDGIIISLTNQTNNIDHLQIVNEFEIPIILFDKVIPQFKHSTITIDDAKAAAQCISYLIEKKCKHIVGVFGNENLRITANRKAGMLELLQLHTNIEYSIIHADNMYDAKEKMNNLLLHNIKVDGVFCMSDEVLTGASAAMYQQQKLFEITTTAISDGELINYRIPALAYINHDGKKMGTTVANQLFTEINTDEKTVPVFLQLETEFITNV